MSNRDNICDDLIRLQRALDALAADLDAIERRPYLMPRRSEISSGIEGFVDRFAFVVERSRST